MGLDTYAVVVKNSGEYKIASRKPFASIPPVLVGGLLSGNGDGPSFRGKVYNDYVQEVTGESLYQEFIPTEKVKEMANKLEEAVKERKFAEVTNPVSAEEAHALTQWFRVCAENGYAVIGWW